MVVDSKDIKYMQKGNINCALSLLKRTFQLMVIYANNSSLWNSLLYENINQTAVHIEKEGLQKPDTYCGDDSSAKC